MPAVADRDRELERGSIWSLRRESLRRPDEFDRGIREDLWLAPHDRKAQASEIKTNVYANVDLIFPVLLRKQPEHRMKAAEFYRELDMIVGMTDIKDPNASVFVYSFQVIDPRNFGDRLNKMVLDLVPAPLLPEITNGYFRHEVLYELGESERSMILVNAIQSAAKIEVSLKPPWSPYRVCVFVTLE
jgi:hypothetical protein